MEPFIKQNGEPIYVNINSNHPIAVIKRIPRSINSRLNRYSSNIDIFNKYKPIYEVGLKNSAYISTKLEYSDGNQDKNDCSDNNSSSIDYDKRKKKKMKNNDSRDRNNNDDDNNSNNKDKNRRVLWFTPPFNKQVKTNIGKIFINLIKKHFPPSHKLHKIFNRNTLKVGYSCIDNIDKIIFKKTQQKNNAKN